MYGTNEDKISILMDPTAIFTLAYQNLLLTIYKSTRASELQNVIQYYFRSSV
jgi:hypothetical protein